MSAPIFAAGTWKTNGELIAAVADLGYLRPTDLVLDPTYGRGNWWTVWRPEHLIAPSPAKGFDFTAMPYNAGTFDVVAYDPPYVCVGGRKTTGLADMHDAFGLTDAPASPRALQQLIDEGLTECARVVRRRGIVLVKCQDYVSSGRLWLGTHHTLTHALALGLECVDRLEHVSGVRPQPPGRRQVHARRNLSTLFVFRRTA